MDRIAALPSRAIYEVLFPTFKIFTPLLQHNSAAIKAIPKESRSYGSHPRQQLDIYTPPANASATQPAPILIFFYGGGLVTGDRILSAIPDGLAYANLGAFFASHGFLTLIPDYRRLNNAAAGTGEDAVYPSGATDLETVLEWVESGGLKSSSDEALDVRSADRSRDIFIMGNSAGGIHLATWLLAPQFEGARKVYLSGSGEVVRLRGAIFGAVPFHFRKAEPGRSEVLYGYYGDAEGVEKKSPFGLLEALRRTGTAETQKQSQAEQGIPPVLSLEGELDPEEILVPGKDFLELWKEVFGGGMEEWVLEGHNHISPPIALMSGDRKSEKWGEDVVGWMKEMM